MRNRGRDKGLTLFLNVNVHGDILAAAEPLLTLDNNDQLPGCGHPPLCVLNPCEDTAQATTHQQHDAPENEQGKSAGFGRRRDGQIIKPNIASVAGAVVEDVYANQRAVERAAPTV